MQRLQRTGIAVLSGALLCAPAAFAQSPQGTPSTQSAGAQTAGTTGTAGATVEKIADNPTQWYGKKVTIKARVGDVFSKRVFNVEEEGIVDVDDEVLIVAPKHSAYLNPDQMVTVTGTVRSFVRSDIERSYDGRDWDLAPELLLQVEKRPVILADTLAAGKVAGRP